ncbi:MAG TPA: LacI family DNA-binding transcriptional regulator [Rhodopila sp.]|nr:LacI family DNA-binding transcriptional regulator [Rhodopila sp.]
MNDAAPPAAPTLAEVAARAGVSTITVSRVARTPALVRPQTRERVEQAMRELGYIPNLVAGSLASARTRSVGVLVPTIANSIFADTVQGLSDVLEPLGIAVILAQSGYDAAREDRMLAALLSRRPDALLMVGSPATDTGASLLRRARVPVVEMWELPEAPIDAAAGFDNHAAGAAVARHFAARGRRRLAFLAGDDARAIQRWNGFRRALLDLGHHEPRRVVIERSALAAAAALSELGDADGVFAANDAHAIGLLSALSRVGLARAGAADDQPVAVIGLGDIEMGRLITPRLSTIRVHGRTIGEAAARLVLDHSGPRRIDVGFELVVRESG